MKKIESKHSYVFFCHLWDQSPKKEKIDSFQTQKLDEVVLSSNRLETPLRQNSKTIQILNTDQIRQSGVTHVVDLLQQIAGVDIKEGAGSTQADLNIRGGTFDQTLLLIDGIN